MNNLVEGIAALSGAEFIREFPRLLAPLIDMSFVFVGEMSNTPGHVRAISFWAKDKYVEGYEYPLPDSPCENVYGKETCVYRSHVQRDFPNDLDLKTFGVEGYLGTPLFSANGWPQGMIVALDDEPIEDPEWAKQVVEFFAPRVGAEFESYYARESIELSEQWVSGVIESNSVGVCVMDAELRFVRVNEPFERLLDYTPGQLSGQSLHDVFSQDDLAYIQQFVANQNEIDDDQLRYTARLLANTGRIVWADVSLKIVEAHETSATSLVMVVVDISELVGLADRVGEERRGREYGIELSGLTHRMAMLSNDSESEAEALKAGIEEVCKFVGWPIGHVYWRSQTDRGKLDPSDIWHISGDEKYSYFKMATCDRSFMVGEGLPGAVLESGRPIRLESILETGNFPRHEAAERCGLRGGFAFPVLAHGNVEAVLEFFSEESGTELPVGLEQAVSSIGVMLGRVVERNRALKERQTANAKLISEVAHHQLTNKALIEARDDAERANRSKSEFLASMSHELRTPMNAVLGFAQMLKYSPSEPLSNRQLEYVNNVIDGGEHLNKLLDDVLDLAKVEADQVVLSVEDVEVEGVVSDSVAMVSTLALEREVDIFNNVIGDSRQTLLSDPARLKQVLLNLLTNAIKYNHSRGSVTIDGAVSEHEFYRLSVTDTGIGIPKDEQDKIFEMFHRLGADPMIAREGVGIGLSVSKTLVDKMGGQMGVESEEGAGSTFWVELPLASNEEVLIWTDEYKVGIDAIDADHQVIFSLTNVLSQNRVGDDELDAAIEELIDYTQYHFDREEQIMAKCGYPDLDAHQQRHLDLISQINEIANNWRVDKSPTTRHILRVFLKNWWIGHITNVDKTIAEHVDLEG